MPLIVKINVSQQVAPTPADLQRKGALISQGGTTLAAGSFAPLYELEDLTPLYRGSVAITSATWLAGVVTVTTAAAHGIPVGDTINGNRIAGCTPAAYNGKVNVTSTGNNTFTYPLALNPGPLTTPGMFTLEDVDELCQMATTFWAQGNNVACYVLELGPGTAAEGVAVLTAFLIANASTQLFYSYLVPRNWADEPTYPVLLQSYQNPEAKTYFHTTVTLGNRTNFDALDKCALCTIEAPAVTANPVNKEFTAAAMFRASLSYRPGATSRVTPLAFTYVYGVTPYPTIGNSALLQTLSDAGVNFITTGAEGGISNTMLWKGTTMDGRDFTYWYSCDWCQINIERNVSNAVINGSNNKINPLYYEQPGIDRLNGVVVQTMGNGVTFGLVLFPPVELSLDGPDLDEALDLGTYNGKTVCNAIPFIPYSQENPGDYKIGRYSGLSSIYTPKRGFDEIIFNLVVSDFVTNT